MTGLAVVIPVRNEAQRLPLLLADLQRAPTGLVQELVVVDGGSGDGSAQLARLSGARVLHSRASRGRQLHGGVAASTAPWLLLLHADARLCGDWAAVVQRAQAAPAAAWHFDLAVEGPGLQLRLLEWAVWWRCRLRQLPYGDQGLLLPRPLLEQAGGIAPLALMEDLELIERLRRITAIRSLDRPLRVDGRSWRRHGVLGSAWRNWRLRQAWRRGDDPALLAQRYYGSPGR